MIIVDTTKISNGVTGDTINVITRQTDLDTLTLRDDTTNDVVSISFTYSAESYYTVIMMTYDVDDFKFIEGRTYDLVIKSASGNIAYKDRLFATNQLETISTENGKYTINKDIYTSDDNGDNDYIVLN